MILPKKNKSRRKKNLPKVNRKEQKKVNQKNQRKKMTMMMSNWNNQFNLPNL